MSYGGSYPRVVGPANLGDVLRGALKQGRAYETRRRAVTREDEREERRSRRGKRGRGRSPGRSSSSGLGVQYRTTEPGITERLGAAIAKGAFTKQNASVAGRLFKQVKGMGLRDLVRAAPTKGAGVAGLLGVAALAGIAAYTLTSAALNYRARTKEERAENAFRAAQAYRSARLTAEEQQRKPLTAAQRGTLKKAFHNELAKLGLTTSNLGAL